MFELNRSVFSIYFRELIEIPNILLTSASDNLCLIRTAASQEIRWLNIILIISRSWFSRSIIFPSFGILISELPYRPR
ncbi:hypothetical protein Q604_UNBC03086G0001, partial [human gut metagenome]